MARFALVHPASNRIAQIAPEPFDVSADFIWVDISARPESDEQFLAGEWRDGEFTLPPPQPPWVPPVPQIISRRQFFQAAAGRGMITQPEALDAVRHGEIPVLMQQGIDTLSSEEKFAAEMLLSGAGEFDRTHPLVAKFGETMSMPPAALDELWREAAIL